MLPTLDATPSHAHGNGQVVGSSAGWLRVVHQAVYEVSGDENRVPRTEPTDTGEYGVETRRIGADRRG